MGGSVEASSEPGQLTVFTVRLPLAAAGRPRAHRRDADPRLSLAEPFYPGFTFGVRPADRPRKGWVYELRLNGFQQEDIR